MNYAYALEQLEAAFYAKVLDVPFHGVTSNETNTFAQIRDHETAHREFFKKALGESAISEIKVDFSSVNFESRDSVLGTADAFENLGLLRSTARHPCFRKLTIGCGSVDRVGRGTSRGDDRGSLAWTLGGVCGWQPHKLQRPGWEFTAR